METDDREYRSDGVPLFSPPKNLSRKSPMRLLSIDKLEQGEEILPKDFVLIFSPDWQGTEIQGVQGLYQKIVPVIGICGRAIFLNSKYEYSEVEVFLNTHRRK